MSSTSVSRPRAQRRAPARLRVGDAALPMVFVTALGAALRLVDFTRVRVNPFYDAAVRSMGQSWHNFFYGAFEPSGQVSIDKTPVDLWLQVASTKLFGFTPIALRLPEVVAGVLAVPLLYDLVRRFAGPRAGLLSATALAVLPISVVTARSDTMDSLMMLCLIGTAWLIVRAAESERPVLLIAAGAVMGLAFNVKLFEALIALPAIGALALLTVDGSFRRRARVLTAAAVAFIGVSLSWLIAVTLSPSHGRPFPIGSTDGSVWNVVFAYNGLDRVKTPPSQAQAALDPAGITRLFGTGGVVHGRLIGSMLLAALALGIAALGTVAWHHLRREAPPSIAGTAAPHRRAGAIFFGLWLVIGVALFSHMGRLHPRYEDAFTPAVAGCVGMGLAFLSERFERDAIARWALVIAVFAVAVLAPGIATPSHPSGEMPPAIGLVALAAAAVLALLATGLVTLPRVRASVVGALGAIAVLLVPATSSVHLTSTGASSSGRPGYAPPARVAALSAFLIKHQGNARYETASTAVAKAGPLIVHDGRPVLMLTSLYQRPLLTPAALADLVAQKQVKYVLVGGDACIAQPAHCAPVVNWARSHGIDVSRAAGQRPGNVYQLGKRRTA